MTDYERYCKALANYSCPNLFLDITSLEKNIQWVKTHAGMKKIRIATKSVRSIEVLKKILASGSPFQGLMTFTLKEALWLRDQGFDDILMGYPTIDTHALKTLSSNPQGITLMVDRKEHLDLIQKVALQSQSNINICVDIDLSMDLPGLRFGVFRSHINSIQRMKEFLGHLKHCPNLKLTGLMGYEAQIAGVMDTSMIIRGLKKLSIQQLKNRRRELVDLILREGHKLEIINGGGSGSLNSTTLEDEVTEVTVGSAFYASVLFDHYDSLKLLPSLFFALPVLRKPEDGIVTLLGGGYIASGSINPIKAPLPYLPQGLELLKHEGAGEVQTPLKTHQTKLDIGDLVIMRHAKAGELCERFKEILIVKNDQVIETVNTYRGDGQAFL